MQCSTATKFPKRNSLSRKSKLFSKCSRNKCRRVALVDSLHLIVARKKAQALRASIQLRKEAMHRGFQSQAQSQNHLLEARQTLAERKSTQVELALSLAAQRRRICLDLQNIYPIDSVDDESLSFTIRGARLPATGKFDKTLEEEVSTALGWTAHLVYLLSGYLSVPLRYPVHPVGGRSLLKDPISIMMGSRTYISRPCFITDDRVSFISLGR
jgi:UV radiation resistance-associated gene protein